MNKEVILIVADIICIVMLFISFFSELSKKEQVKKLKEWLLYAVTLAEKEYGSNTGQIKLRYVYDLFVNKFSWLSKIISFEDFSKYVDEALEQMEHLIESNEAIDAIVKGV